MPDAEGVDYTTPSGRTFHVWGPENYDPSKTYPVLVMFHGWYSTGRDFESWFEMEKYAVDDDGAREAFVVYPDGLNQLWDLDGTTDLVFFDELVEQMGETYCINPSRVFGFGFSYGARFVHHLGCKRAGYVKAISGGDGGWGGGTTGCGRLPVLVTHRTEDDNELIAWGKEAADRWTKLDVCGTDTKSDDAMNCTIHTTCKSPGSPVTFCEDTSIIPSDIPGYEDSWKHTVREAYRAYTWKWFRALP
jgi:polyhydroxybutyrate depolymerase